MHCIARGQQRIASVVVSGITATTLCTAFTLLALGIETFWVVFIVGFGGVLPISLTALQLQTNSSRNSRDRQQSGKTAKTHRQHQQTETNKDSDIGTQQSGDVSLEQLRLRYARGELSDTEFEQRVEKLVETEQKPSGDRVRRS